MQEHFNFKQSGRMRYSTILFDLDGTLTDSQQGITTTISRVLQKLGQGSVSPENLVWCVGPPLRDSFIQLLGGEEARADEAMRLFGEFYEAGGMFLNRVYPGVCEALERLYSAGLRLAVVTGKPSWQAMPILKHFGLARFFHSVHGPTADDRSEDKGRLLKRALEALGEPTELCLYVGDRAVDVRGASANGLRMIAVRYGYGSDDELREAGAMLFADSPADWLKVVLS